MLEYSLSTICIDVCSLWAPSCPFIASPFSQFTHWQRLRFSYLMGLFTFVLNAHSACIRVPLLIVLEYGKCFVTVPTSHVQFICLWSTLFPMHTMRVYGFLCSSFLSAGNVVSLILLHVHLVLCMSYQSEWPLRLVRAVIRSCLEWHWSVACGGFIFVRCVFLWFGCSSVHLLPCQFIQLWIYLIAWTIVFKQMIVWFCWMLDWSFLCCLDVSIFFRVFLTLEAHILYT